MQKSLAGKTALVTGSAIRIGRTTAVELAAEGVNLVIHYRSSESEAASAVEEVGARGVKVWTVQADFANLADSESLIHRTLRVTGGSLDFLVNNASIFDTDTIDEVDYGALEENIRINAWAPFVLTREFAQRCKRGSVVNIIDARINGSDRPHTAYIASKHLLAAFTKMTALYYAPAIRINGVSPALILPPKGKDEAYLAALDEIVPLKMHGAPEDIAAAVVYLLKNDFITGHVIDVDGGYHLNERQKQ